MAKEKTESVAAEPVLTGAQILCAVFGYGVPQATSFLAELKLSDSDVQAAFKNGREALEKFIDDAADKIIAENAAAEEAKKANQTK
jgi:hypothetical protein